MRSVVKAILSCSDFGLFISGWVFLEVGWLIGSFLTSIVTKGAFASAAPVPYMTIKRRATTANCGWEIVKRTSNESDGTGNDDEMRGGDEISNDDEIRNDDEIHIDDEISNDDEIHIDDGIINGGGIGYLYVQEPMSRLKYAITHGEDAW